MSLHIQDSVVGCITRAVDQVLAADEARSSGVRGIEGGESHGADGVSQPCDCRKFAIDDTLSDTGDFFSKDVDMVLGVQLLRNFEGIQAEHVSQLDSHVEFSCECYSLMTTPATEFECVFEPDPFKTYPGPTRNVLPLEELMKAPEAAAAGLTLVEMAALRLYTGPMFMKYNAALAEGWRMYGHGRCDYATTIRCLLSGIAKLSKIMVIPRERKVYIGCPRSEMPQRMRETDEAGCCGGVSYIVRSATMRQELAAKSSRGGLGDGNGSLIPTVVCVELGQVDKGADVMWLSLYPAEEEILFAPLCNIELMGKAYVEIQKSGDHSPPPPHFRDKGFW